MFAKLLGTLVLLIAFIISVKCNNIENDTYIIIEEADGTIHNISLLDTLEDDEYYKWNEPFDPEETLPHVNSYLYTNENPDVPYELTPATIIDASFNIDLPTKVIVHGWLEKADKYWVLGMKDKYLHQGEYNIIILNWYYYSLMKYFLAALKTRKVGQYLGDILVRAIQAQKIRPKDIHLIGHSLGSHITGYAGKAVYAQTGKKVARITGLDVARPLYEFPLLVSEKKRLAREDAEFVDVIHTNAWALGFERAIGHADFYPNGGGILMPGCKLLAQLRCSHDRSYRYYLESINTTSFVAYRCLTWNDFKHGRCKDASTQPMGHFVSTSARGDYYLRTNAKSPFARG